MTRKLFTLCLTPLLLCAAVKPLQAASDQLPPKPNILFIITDQQNARMLSCAGNNGLKTPALDSLARDGMRFAKVYSANPVCVPSRTSMATGMMPCRLGAEDNTTGMRNLQLPSEVKANSMGEIMRRAGYATFYGGKVHMCPSLVPKNAGYEEYFADERNRLPGACLKFMTAHRDQPFFAVASFINPHDICFADYARKGVDKEGILKLHNQAAALPQDQLPPLPANYAIPENEPAAIAANLSTEAVTPTMTMRQKYDATDWRINRWIYERLTERADGLIGELLDGLKKAGLEDNTIVIFTSDHGNMDASHRLASKGFPYEESVGILLIMKYKGHIPAGTVDREHLVSSGLDILPTFCDYAGVAKPVHLLGMSLRPLAEGKPVAGWRSYVASENGWFRMIRSQQFKYCAFAAPNSGESLVDLEKDPGEMHNLAGNPDYKQVLAEHRALLADWARRSKDKQIRFFLEGSQ